jgi:hypothetical protein
MTIRPDAAVAVLLALPAVTAFAQTKPPIAQFWMDVATNNMSIPGMGDMESGMGGMFGGGFFGATKMGGGSPGKWLDTALYTRNKPSGTEGTHAIPPAMNMGNTLPLLPVAPVARGRSGEEHEGTPEKPRGRLLFYWGCSETVRPGQPRTVDFSKSSPEEWGRFMTGRFAPDRGAKAVPGRSVWPNDKDGQRVPKDASLEGDHAVSGEGVPPGLRFSLREAYDFMPKVNLTAAGDPKASVAVGWQPVTNAFGYFLTAMGGRQEEMIIWSSSEQPDPGWGLMDYLPPAQVKKLIGEKVVIAYGPELNLAHPPRPANPKAVWEPEWAARVRVKSTGMTMLGAEDRSGRGRRSGREESEPAQEGSGTGGVSPLNVIKGIFGR